LWAHPFLFFLWFGKITALEEEHELYHGRRRFIFMGQARILQEVSLCAGKGKFVGVIAPTEAAKARF
jgi:hypothetical protein